jgi:hypothetical protein
MRFDGNYYYYHEYINKQKAKSKSAMSKTRRKKNLEKKSSIHIYIFFNPKSGNCQGTHLGTYSFDSVVLKNGYDVNFVNLFDKDRVSFILNIVKIDHVDPLKMIFIFSAGGDGTFISVMEKLISLDIDIHQKNLIFSNTIVRFFLNISNEIFLKEFWQKSNLLICGM